MKILFIADGTGVHGERWIRWFAGRGHRCVWVSLGPPERPIDGVETMVLPRAGSNPLRLAVNVARASLRARAIIGAVNPDVIQAHVLNPSGWYAWMAARRPAALHLWGSDIYRHGSRTFFARWLSARAFQWMDLVTGDSDNLLDTAERLCGAARRRALIYWGVDTAMYHPDDREGARRRLGIDRGPVILTTRNWLPAMNVPRLIDAFGAIRRRYPTATLLIKKGFPLTGPESDVVAAAKRAGSNGIRLVREVRDDGEMALYYRAADVFVTIPTPGCDGTPVSLYEAMACGATPVVSRNPDNLELVRDGVNGFVVTDEQRADSIAATVIAALEAGSTTRITASNAAMIRDTMSRDLWLGRMEKMLEEIAGRP
jgi:glycosyltransferase involved in cell wall biosynthesis